MDGWTLAVIAAFLLSLAVCLNMAAIARGIAHLINAPREAALLRMVEETSHYEQKEPIYSDEIHQVMNTLATAMNAGRISIAPQHQEIEPYTPPDAAMELWQIGKATPVGYLDKYGRVYHASEPLPRYEIVMVDDWQSRYDSDMPVNRNEKVIAPFLRDETAIDSEPF